ncbi:MAG: PAS domain-containing protein [Candidatus Hatepunaea meridiana]|nr:PAS domain-containing protein [Candidatus Hatepunaea meridiana]
MNEIPNTPSIAPEGHPIHTLMEEHNSVLGFAAEFVKSTEALKELNSFEEARELGSRITGIIDHFKASQKHYLREENVLFPYLEKHGVSGPPSQMWAEHDQIRDCEKKIYALMEEVGKANFSSFKSRLNSNAIALFDLLMTHYNKENKILFPMALKLFTEEEWQETIRQFNEIGYCCFSPKSALTTVEKAETKTEEKLDSGGIDTGSGQLSTEELVAMLNTLPVEITFVDKDDTFRYFNKVKDAVFVRTVAAIGTKVQNCHPQKSVHMVNQILADFKSGAKDEVGFWIHLQDKYVYIRYFAVRDQEGKYLGSMEVTQDIKDIQEISGDKRLMD